MSPPGGFSILLWAIKAQDRLTATTKMVLVALASHADPQGVCWPSLPLLAAEARLSTRAVQNAIQDLEGLGYLIRERGNGRGHSSRYRLLLDRESASGEVALPPPERMHDVPAFESENVHLVPPLPAEKVHEVHPLRTERVHVVPIKGARRARELLIELPKQAARDILPLSLPRQRRASAAPRWPTKAPMPQLDDPPEAWLHLTSNHETNRETGATHAVAGGYYVDVIARLVCEAAGMPNGPPGRDWPTLIQWLDDGLDRETILQEVRRVSARQSDPPRTLKYFDAAIRATRSATTAG